MAKFLAFFATFLLIQVTFGARVAREEPAETNVFDEISKQATTFLSDVSNQINQVTSAKDTTELTNILKTNTDTFVAKAQDIAKGLQEQFTAATGDSKTILGQAVAKINETIADLKTKYPEATAKTEEINENLQKGLQTLLQEADKVAKNVVDNSKGLQDDLSKITKKAYDQVVETSKNIQKDVHEYANKE